MVRFFSLGTTTLCRALDGRHSSGVREKASSLRQSVVGEPRNDRLVTNAPRGRTTMRPAATGTVPATIALSADEITVDHLVLRDAELAAYMSETDEEARPSLAERGLRIGLLTLRGAGVTVNVDYIEKEFGRLLQRTDESHGRAAEVVADALRVHFADDDGKLPRTLEKFLGDEGSFRRFVDDLFDEERRDSAIGKIRTLLDGYFDGDGAVLARLLDPRSEDSPLHGFRAELREALKGVEERLLRLEAGREARADERAKGTAKGGDFEDEVERSLGTIAHGFGDVIEATGRAVGDRARCKKGDFVQTLNPSATYGQSICLAIEAKSGSVPLAKISRELDDARHNRGAAVAVAVFHAGCAPTGCAPLTLYGEHVICEADPDDPDDATLETAIRLGRALAIASLRDRSGTVNLAAVRTVLDRIREQLRVVRSMKSRLTSIGTVSREVSDALDGLRSSVLDSVADIEEEMARDESLVGQRGAA